MHKEEKHAFAKAQGIHVDQLDLLIEIMKAIASSKEAFFQACVRLHAWIDESTEVHSRVAIALMVEVGYTERQSTLRLREYLKFGAGDLDDRFFGLPPGMIDRAKKFSKKCINELMKDPVIQIVRYVDENVPSMVGVDWRELERGEFKQVFTASGIQRSEAQQLVKLNSHATQETVAVANGQVYTTRGYKTMPYMTRRIAALGESATTVRKAKAFLNKVNQAAKRIEEHIATIEDKVEV